jgi:uncharacterized NAD(P)/FAD-binding protein YdhS
VQGRRSFSSATESGAKILISRTTCAHCFVYDSAKMYRMDWTDDRLRERFDSIDHRFDGVDRRLDRADQNFRDLWSEVNQRFDGVDRKLAEMNQRFEAMNRTLLQIGGGILATLIAGIFGVIATQL